jgi:DNA-binding HxlR family transcriptional regulator
MENRMFETNKNVRMRKNTSTNTLNKLALEKDCPIAFTISMIGGRWKLSILALLHDFGPLRYGEIRTKLPGMSERMLTLQLRELEQFALISRTIYPHVPAHSEYALTGKGKSLEKVLNEMTKWGQEQRG